MPKRKHDLVDEHRLGQVRIDVAAEIIAGGEHELVFAGGESIGVENRPIEAAIGVGDRLGEQLMPAPTR